MRELKGANELHKPNSVYNTKVVEAIKIAKLSSTLRDYIDLLNGAKAYSDIT